MLIVPAQNSAFFSPRMFTRVVTRVVGAALSPFQLSGVKILQYLDNWLICAPSLSQVVEDTKRAVALIQSLGFKVNVKKATSNQGSRQFLWDRALLLLSPTWEHFVEKNGVNHRHLPNRLGSGQGRIVHGVWKPPCGGDHINVLELRAVHLALKVLLPSI